jgi:hypothetical protein
VQHEQSRKHKDAVDAAAAAKRRTWHCDTCNIDIPNTAQEVAAHNASHEHTRLRGYDGEENRDGPILAKEQRRINCNSSGEAAGNAKRSKQSK